MLVQLGTTGTTTSSALATLPAVLPAPAAQSFFHIVVLLAPKPLDLVHQRLLAVVLRHPPLVAPHDGGQIDGLVL